MLRLDDRGFGASPGDFAAATSADFAEDVRAALAYLRARRDIDAARLGLIGHSEGGLIAPLVAAVDAALAAIVLIAGPVQTGREIIAFQQRQAIERLPSLTEAERDSPAVGDPAGYSALETRTVSRAVLGALADWLAGTLRRTQDGEAPEASLSLMERTRTPAGRRKHKRRVSLHAPDRFSN